MIVKKITTNKAGLVQKGNYTAAMPLIDAAVTVAVLIDASKAPAVLQTITRVEDPQNSDGFLYQQEENIEIDSEGKSLSADELLAEVNNSIGRCYKNAREACVTGSLVFPFPKECPKVDLTSAYHKLQEDLS